MVLKSQEPEPEPGKRALAVTPSMEGMGTRAMQSTNTHLRVQQHAPCPLISMSNKRAAPNAFIRFNP